MTDQNYLGEQIFTKRNSGVENINIFMHKWDDEVRLACNEKPRGGNILLPGIPGYSLKNPYHQLYTVPHTELATELCQFLTFKIAFYNDQPL